MSNLPMMIPDGGGGNGLPAQAQPWRDGVTLSLSLSPSPSPSPSPESDISRMPDFPPRNLGHRRAHSEIIGLPDDLDLAVDVAGDGPSLSDENEEELFAMFLDVEKLSSPCGGASASDAESSCTMAAAAAGEAPVRPRHHQHSHSVDVSSFDRTAQLLGTPAMEGLSPAEAKKAMSTAKLAELALVDPKKAKRIWANRQSAARSKERKMRYIAELERKVQAMHSDATTLSTQLALLQRDTAGLTTENNELKMRLQNVEQQVHLQDALNDALKSELQRLKMATGQMGGGGGGGGMMSFSGGPPPHHSFGGSPPQMFHHHQRQAMPLPPLLDAHQMQQMQLRPPHHHQQPPPQLHPLHAQQLQMQQQAALDMKMKGPMAAPGQWGAADGWPESSGC